MSDMDVDMEEGENSGSVVGGNSGGAQSHSQSQQTAQQSTPQTPTSYAHDSSESEVGGSSSNTNPTTKWFLESIYIENFKSYEGVTLVGPLKPFCAIIGPNGSGKSNLMDAISFVMGERTTSLRVKRMNELIHGASIDKPLSANASVEAVFKTLGSDIEGAENQREMRFKRSIRDGRETSSEYKVNGQVVSQQDYFIELKKLGINPRGKNFLVFQGAIESIAMKNAKERTALLEEICGSGALKEAYETAKAELADAERSIETVFQKKKNVTMLRKEANFQVQESKKYNELLAQQSEKEIELYLFKLFHLNEDIDENVGRLLEKEQEHQRCDVLKRKTEAELKEKKKERGELSRSLCEKEALLNEIESEKNKKLPRQIQLTQKKKSLEKNLIAAEKSLKQAKGNKRSQEIDLEHLRQSFSNIKEKEREFLEDHAELNLSQGIDISFRESQVQEYWNLKEEVIKETETERRERERLCKKKKDATEVFNSVSEEKTKLENDLELTSYEIQEQKKLAKKSFETMQDLKEQIRVKEAEFIPLQHELSEAKESSESLQQEYEKLSAEIHAAKFDRHEVNRKSKKVEVIKALQSHFKGVKGRVANLCKIRHSRYNIAITKIMEKNMEAIVVDSEKTATECIRYLKEQMLDPEVFLPLDLLQVKPLRTRIREQIQGHSELHLAYDLLEFDHDIEKAILHCVKSTVVCPTSRLASKIASGEYFEEATNAVSLEGTLYQTSGIISGGKADLQKKARRWDDKMLAEKEQQKAEIVEKLHNALKTLQKSVKLEVLEQELTGSRNRLKYAKQDYNSHVDAAKGLEIKRTKLEAALTRISGRFNQLESERNQVLREIKKIEKQIHAKEDERFKGFCEAVNIPNIRAYEEKDVREQEEFNHQKEKFRYQLQQIQAKIDCELEQQRSVENNIQRWEKTVSDSKEKLHSCQLELDSIQTEITEINTRLSSAETEVKTIRESSEKKGKEVAELNKKLTTVDKACLSVHKEITHFRNLIYEKKLKRHDIFKQCKLTGTNIPLTNGSLDEIRVAESANDESNSGLCTSIGNAQEIFEIDEMLEVNYETLDPKYKKLTGPRIEKTEEELEAQLQELEVKIGQIQAPNMNANEKWESVNSKIREQQAEFDEVRKKVKLARETFEKVKKERTEKFMDCFNKISQNIEGIYKILTRHNSAQAVLGLDNPEEPYLDGVSYHCVVPGKRFQPMSNLSGGEKTLAALALLFAIHSYEPAPFFILDEIDAALDNTNIGKVTSYIKESTANLQILVISLKEEFYNHADALLGVAPDVQETECLRSKLYSLDLTQYD